MNRPKNLDECQEGLPQIIKAPRDDGVLEAIVIRPATDQRVSLTSCELSPQRGVHGDSWERSCGLRLPDGSPHPDVQVTITSSRVMATIAEGQDQWPQAGDNLYVDLDLSGENLPCGQQLRIGSVLLQVTSEPHNGCRKFAARFGADALKFVNSPEGKRLHLRGIYARILRGGTVRVGDRVLKE